MTMYYYGLKRKVKIKIPVKIFDVAIRDAGRPAETLASAAAAVAVFGIVSVTKYTITLKKLTKTLTHLIP